MLIVFKEMLRLPNLLDLFQLFCSSDNLFLLGTRLLEKVRKLIVLDLTPS
jgi:hypothetical protein